MDHSVGVAIGGPQRVSPTHGTAAEWAREKGWRGGIINLRLCQMASDLPRRVAHGTLSAASHAFADVCAAGTAAGSQPGLRRLGVLQKLRAASASTHDLGGKALTDRHAIQTALVHRVDTERHALDHHAEREPGEVTDRGVFDLLDPLLRIVSLAADTNTVVAPGVAGHVAMPVSHSGAIPKSRAWPWRSPQIRTARISRG